MKFYTDLNKFDLKLFFSHNYFYETYHNWFYLCLLPKEIKLTLLNLFEPTKRNIFQSILNVTEEFCSSIEECDYVLLSPTSIHECSIQKYKFEIKHAIKNNKKIIFFIHLPMDSDTSFNIPHKIGIGFRATGLLSEATDNIFGLPMVNLDVFSKNYASKKLSISFCGYFDNGRHQIRMNVVNKFLKEIPEKCDFSYCV